LPKPKVLIAPTKDIDEVERKQGITTILETSKQQVVQNGQSK
jgi:hypothetical protein